MKNWDPEQQIRALKYGAYSTLFASGMFASSLARNISQELQWQHTSWLAILAGVFAVGFVITCIRWSIKNRPSGGWRELIGVYSEELAREVNRKANSNAFLVTMLMLVPAYILGDAPMLENLGPAAELTINLSNFALFLLTLSAAVWSITVLLHLRDEAGA
ncbi:MAG: hypothetical protein KKE30_08040 [Gammaproteobacteria bacterium]|nr:hypothetical protein [Gammaproteobacteria bacterium]MBU1555498.1 hypothetical protein [Gammaproteobacteria bacterium]MBU2072419.1 hypothetical protein [Gammaproteobacteria bacterium]MBU2183327.1 hypothetical protein [Gammaproteobacteria bacterium]MBU2203114.1 hypothetical protein [Gammaproteobacteria bacterium]